jgi:hypothetical protein
MDGFASLASAVTISFENYYHEVKTTYFARLESLPRNENNFSGLITSKRETL